ncbi:MAG: hypothetical protein RBR22_08220 [Desulfuromonas sp.]|nr:hypothetical protein [Desulfuromonas sp.]
MNEKLNMRGFQWHAEVINPDGSVADREIVFNLIPAEGLDHLIRSPFGDVSPISTFYLGLYRGNYIPAPSTTSADIPNGMIEFVDYSEVARPEWKRALAGTGTMDNLSNKAEFNVTQDRTIYGAFLVSSATKAGNAGLLLSCVRFATPKQVTAGQTVKLSGGLTYTSTNII